MNNKATARWHCNACGKTAFGSESRARQAVDFIATNSTKSKKPKRVYPCPYDNGYHLTSKEVDIYGSTAS